MTSNDEEVDSEAVMRTIDEKDFTIKGKDIRLIIAFMNVMAARGGVKPQEMKVIGVLFESLNDLINKN
tara:strand:+ start:1540 stop:1743 length:204 start_codon:yes stop_codon:yes gene_type:complete